MPELPEVEVIRRDLEKEVVGALTESVGEIASQGFLFVGEGLRHGVILATGKVDYSSEQDLSLKCTDFLPTIERPTPSQSKEGRKVDAQLPSA